VVEVYGAALLAGRNGARHAVPLRRGAIKSGRLKGSMPDARDGAAAAYLERVLSGRDLALVLLPLLNDLRSVRGSPLLSEGTLLLLN